MATTLTYRVKAFNTATASENKIHSDDVAASYGFSGGLVPGVDVYAYLTHLPAAKWGLDWLRQGAMSARFARPVYDGDEVVVAGSEDGEAMDLELRNSRGEVCATGKARRVAPPGGEADASASPTSTWVEIPHRDLPPTPPPASPQTLAPGTVLGAYGGGFHADRAAEYLTDVREPLPLYRTERVAHPGWVLRFANWALSRNVRLGPWIHVASAARFVDVALDRDHVEARAVVTHEHERGGHRFVVLDVAITAGARPIQRVVHTAIYLPRRGPKP